MTHENLQETNVIHPDAPTVRSKGGADGKKDIVTPYDDKAQTPIIREVKRFSEQKMNDQLGALINLDLAEFDEEALWRVIDQEYTYVRAMGQKVMEIVKKFGVEVGFAGATATKGLPFGIVGLYLTREYSLGGTEGMPEKVRLSVVKDDGFYAFNMDYLLRPSRSSFQDAGAGFHDFSGERPRHVSLYYLQRSPTIDGLQLYAQGLQCLAANLLHWEEPGVVFPGGH